MSTAISQNGNLDALLVLSAQSKMVWQVAHVYYQRPTLREITQLYANVVSTAFVASELEDSDILEQVGPIVASASGSIVRAIPGFGAMVSTVTNSILNGTANAFLTLRVGMITRKYCNTLVARDKSLIRKSATINAAALLGSIVSAGAKRVAKLFLTALKGKLTNIGERIQSAITSVTDAVTGATRPNEAQEKSQAAITTQDIEKKPSEPS